MRHCVRLMISVLHINHGSIHTRLPQTLFTIYKIISKIVANMVKKVLNKLIPPKQSGLTPGRQIADGIIVAREVIHSITTCKRSAMLLVLDIKKAYDAVDKSFLFKVLGKFKFCDKWICWIKSMIRDSKISILVNGIPQSFFSASRGLH